MNAELMGLRDRRNDLTRELELLSKREGALRVRARLLERMLRIQNIGTSRQAVTGQVAAGTGGTAAMRRGAKLSRVRLKKNAIFSWSYTKLP